MVEDPNAGDCSDTTDRPMGTGEESMPVSDPPPGGGGGGGGDDRPMGDSIEGYTDPGYQPDSDPVSDPPSSMGTVESDPPTSKS